MSLRPQAPASPGLHLQVIAGASYARPPSYAPAVLPLIMSAHRRPVQGTKRCACPIWGYGWRADERDLKGQGGIPGSADQGAEATQRYVTLGFLAAGDMGKAVAAGR